MTRMRRWLRRSLICILGLVGLAGLAGGAGFLYLRSSLPQETGELQVPGLQAAVTIRRDDRGVPSVTAASSHDAYFTLGFLHAQDRLFQMDAMRRLGAGRLAEVIGPDVLAIDRRMRILGLHRSAEAQFRAASPALREALEAYAAGVNAQLGTRQGALPPEFRLLGYDPEPWHPVDSLIWGRLMALDLSANWEGELQNRRLRDLLPAPLFDLLVDRPVVNAARSDWRQPIGLASNSWSVGPLLAGSGGAMLANDPHLGLGLPSTWYLARLTTPDWDWQGATAPGLPFIVIGSNGRVSWSFTTTHSDTQDLFVERLVAGQPDRYETPDGPMPFSTREERIRVKDAEDVVVTVRATRHGPVVSDVDPAAETVLALAWTALLPDDRTAEAILAINHAVDAAALEVALTDFHAPQQNIVFADQDGVTGMIAAGRVPVRRAPHANSRLPAPGWTGAHDWLGVLPFAELPQIRGGGDDIIVTANSDIRPPGYQPFLTADWPDDTRTRQIRTLLAQTEGLAAADFAGMQMDNHSAPMLAFARRWQALAARAAPDAARILASWNGAMARDQAAPLIAALWLDRTARALLLDEMGGAFDEWWFWQIDRVEAVLNDRRFCDDLGSDVVETCDDIVAGALRQAVTDLTAAYGADMASWRWGDSHRAYFRHPVFRNVPLLRDWLDADMATDGDFFTINRGTPLPPRDGVALPHVHGPGLRFVHDLGDPAGPRFVIAGGQSGNPFSSHYADWLDDWQAGRLRPIGQDGARLLTLKPLQSAP
ncbi:penicillin amidase [Dongia mobilis]|uniref:Penicillin amidase n=1 Tax=Dongia mobilis TaxID=578943 RepID=A0A4R6WPE3_9PROT|nr:penicillin acylase family protein [Dongia mobilis]TDQ80981.1 penicillin amidase [Dongia mobilis]